MVYPAGSGAQSNGNRSRTVAGTATTRRRGAREAEHAPVHTLVDQDHHPAVFIPERNVS